MTVAPALRSVDATHDPPANIEAEQALLGALLYDNSVLELVDGLAAQHFYEPFHGRLFDAATSQLRTGLRVDPVVLADYLITDQAFLELGGLRYLADLVDRAPPSAMAEAYASSVVDNWRKRELARIGQEIAFRTQQETTSGIEQAAEAERSLADLARCDDGGQAVALGLGALEMIEAARRGEYVGTPMGIGSLDRVTGGIRSDDVLFFGARTSMGKSLVAIATALGLALQGRGVLFLSLEMPLREVQARAIASLGYDPEARWDGAYGGNVAFGDILKGRVRDDLWPKATAAAKRLVELPFTISDKGGLTIADVAARARRQTRAWAKAGIAPGAIIIDHIGLVNPTRRTDNKAADTTEIVNELKGLAKSIGAPIIACAQINRAPEGRNDKRPTLGDLNWSGAIEQIADVVCLLYRESYYLERSAADGDWDRAQACKNDIELLIHKNRAGPICTVRAFVDVACNALCDLPGGRQ